MSERLTGRNAAPGRTARVWQSLELLDSAAAPQGFVKQAWTAQQPRSFDPQVVSVWPPVPDPASQVAASAPDATAPLAAAESGNEPGEAGGLEKMSLDSETLEAIKHEAHARGLQEGREQMRTELADQQASGQAHADALLQTLDKDVRALIESPERLHEPLKRLALHLAEQLVLAELSLAPQAIETLVQRCVDELAPQRSAPVTVELHSSDLVWLQSQSLDKSPGKGAAGKVQDGRLSWHFQANDALTPGSVRASASDAVVSDLIEHRLEALARELLLDAPKALVQSAFSPDNMKARLSGARQVTDAQPRMMRAAAKAPDQHDDNVVDTDTDTQAPEDGTAAVPEAFSPDAASDVQSGDAHEPATLAPDDADEADALPYSDRADSAEPDSAMPSARTDSSSESGHHDV